MLIVDGLIDASVYRPVEQWSRLLGGVAFDAVRLPAEESIPDLDPFTHVLLTGSEARFEEPEPWFDAEADLVCKAADRGLPILGSCFGHQMLVWALSGAQYVRRAPCPELGWISVELLVQDGLLGGFPNPWHTFSSHLDEVIDPPRPWRALAANRSCAVQAIRYGDRPIWGIQPHPETNPAEGRSLMRAAMARFPQEADRIRRALEEPVRDDDVAQCMIDAFLRFGNAQSAIRSASVGCECERGGGKGMET